MASELRKEFNWFLKNQTALAKKFKGEYIAIRNFHVINDKSYDDFGVAVEETSKTHELGTFIVQKSTLGELDYTATIYSIRA